MKILDRRARSAKLHLHGFYENPSIIANKINVPCYFFLKGEAKGKSEKRIMENSIVFGYEFNAGYDWGESINQLISSLGGVSEIISLIENISPSNAWFELNLPLLGSPWVETSSISSNVLNLVSELKLSIGFEIFNYESTIPSHNCFIGSS